MATRTKRSQKPVFEYQKPAIEAAAKTRKTVADLLVANKNKRELTAAEQKRANKLQEMISDLESDLHVQNRKLQTWLSADEFAMIDAEWQREQDHRNIYKDKPKPVQEYEAMVAEADFYFNRSERYSSIGNKTQARLFDGRSESKFEDALEHLQDIICGDSSLRMWFDRDTEPCLDNDTGTDTESIPRVVTSRSPKNRASISTRTIRDIKLGVVQQALRDLMYEDRVMPLPAGSSKLQELLKLPDDDLI